MAKSICIPVTLSQSTGDDASDANSLKLGLRSTEVLNFWEPQANYFCESPGGSCGFWTISLYQTYLDNLKGIISELVTKEVEGAVTTETYPPEPVMIPNPLGGAKADKELGHLNVTLNPTSATFEDIGGSTVFHEEGTVPLNALEDYNCQKETPNPSNPKPQDEFPPCPTIANGFTVGSLESSTINISDTVASIGAIQDYLTTSISNSYLYATLLDSKVLASVQAILIDTTIVGNHVEITGNSKMINCSVEAKNLFCSPKNFFYSNAHNDEGFKDANGPGALGGNIAAESCVIGGSWSGTSMALQCGSLGGGFDNCEISISAPEFPDLSTRFEAIIKANGDPFADPALLRRKDFVNRTDLFQYAYPNSENSFIGYPYNCVDYVCPLRYDDDGGLINESTDCQDAAGQGETADPDVFRSGCLEFNIDTAGTSHIQFNAKRLYNLIPSTDVGFDIFGNRRNGNLLILQTNRITHYSDGFGYEPGTIEYYVGDFTPMRFGSAGFLNSSIDINADIKLHDRTSILGSSNFTSTENLTLAASQTSTSSAGTTDTTKAGKLDIYPGSNVDLNNVYGPGDNLGDITTMLPGDGSTTTPRSTVSINGILIASLGNNYGDVSVILSTYLTDAIRNGPMGILNFSQSNIILNHRNVTQGGEINIGNGMVLEIVNYDTATLNFSNISFPQDLHISLGDSNVSTAGNNFRPHEIEINNSKVNCNTISSAFPSEIFGRVKYVAWNSAWPEVGGYYFTRDFSTGAGFFNWPNGKVSLKKSELNIGAINMQGGHLIYLASCYGSIGSIIGEEKAYMFRDSRDVFSQYNTLHSEGATYLTISTINISEFKFLHGTTINGNSFISKFEDGIYRSSRFVGNFSPDADKRNIIKDSDATLNIATIDLEAPLFPQSFDGSPVEDFQIGRRIHAYYIPQGNLRGSVTCSVLRLKNFVFAPLNEDDYTKVMNLGEGFFDHSVIQGNIQINNATLVNYSVNKALLMNSTITDGYTLGSVSDSKLDNVSVAGYFAGTITAHGIAPLSTTEITFLGGEGKDIKIEDRTLRFLQGTNLVITMSPNFEIGSITTQRFGNPLPRPETTINMEDYVWISYLDKIDVGNIKIGRNCNIKRLAPQSAQGTLLTYAAVSGACAGDADLGSVSGEVKLLGPLASIEFAKIVTTVNVSPDCEIKHSTVERVEIKDSCTKSCIIREGIWEAEGSPFFLYADRPSGDEDIYALSTSSSLYAGASSATNFFGIGEPVNENLSLLRKYVSDETVGTKLIKIKYHTITYNEADAGDESVIFLDTSFTDVRNSWMKKIHWGDDIIYKPEGTIGKVVGCDKSNNSILIGGNFLGDKGKLIDQDQSKNDLTNYNGKDLYLRGKDGGGPRRKFPGEFPEEDMPIPEPLPPTAGGHPHPPGSPYDLDTTDEDGKTIITTMKGAEAKILINQLKLGSKPSNFTIPFKPRYADEGSIIGHGIFENVNVKPTIVTGDPDRTTTFKTSVFDEGMLGANKFTFDDSLYLGPGKLLDGADVTFNSSMISKDSTMNVQSSTKVRLTNTTHLGRIVPFVGSTLIVEGASENYGLIGTNNLTSTATNGSSIDFLGSTNIGLIKTGGYLDFASSINWGGITVGNINLEGADNKGSIEIQGTFPIDLVNVSNGGSITIAAGPKLHTFRSSTNNGKIEATKLYFPEITPSIPSTVTYGFGLSGDDGYRTSPALYIGSLGILLGQSGDHDANGPMANPALAACRNAVIRAASVGFISTTNTTLQDILGVLAGNESFLSGTAVIGTPGDQVFLGGVQFNTEKICHAMRNSKWYSIFGSGDSANLPDTVLNEGLWYDPESFTIVRLSFTTEPYYDVNSGSTVERVKENLYSPPIDPFAIFPQGSFIAQQVITPFIGTKGNISGRGFEPAQSPYIWAKEKYVFTKDYELDRPYPYR